MSEAVRLQVGDVARLKGHRGKKTIDEIDGDYIGFVSEKGIPHHQQYRQDVFLRLAKIIHRPTLDGMKQVWPEVEHA